MVSSAEKEGLVIKVDDARGTALHTKVTIQKTIKIDKLVLISSLHYIRCTYDSVYSSAKKMIIH